MRRPHAHRGLEHLDAALARVLRHVHGDVGVAQQVFGGLPAVPVRDADARADPHLVPRHAERAAQGLDDPPPDGLRDLRAAVGEDRELVAAQPGRRVLGPYAAEQALRGRAQQLVARRVAERVVDVLEPVEVDQDHRDGRARGRRAAEPVEQQLSLIHI